MTFTPSLAACYLLKDLYFNVLKYDNTVKRSAAGKTATWTIIFKGYLENRSIDEFYRRAGKKILLPLHFADDVGFISTQDKKSLNKFIRFPSKLFLIAKMSWRRLQRKSFFSSKTNIFSSSRTSWRCLERREIVMA